jgi:hypothetical protein
VPFWAHQLAELLLGVVLLFEGARSGTHVAVMVAGGVLLLFTLVTDGPLAAWPRLPRRAHRMGDFAFAALLAISPLLVGAEDALAILLLEVAAVVMLWLALRGDFRTPKARPARSRAPAAPATPPAATPATPASTASSTPPGGAKTGGATSAAPSVPSPRDAGRALGRLRTGGVRAVGRAVGKASAERATEQGASAERATEQGASAERAAEQGASGPAAPQAEGNGRDESSPE